jgi:hypothetical protein
MLAPFLHCRPPLEERTSPYYAHQSVVRRSCMHHRSHSQSSQHHLSRRYLQSITQSDTFLSILTSISALSRSFSSLRNSVAAPAAADDEGDMMTSPFALAWPAACPTRPAGLGPGTPTTAATPAPPPVHAPPATQLHRLQQRLQRPRQTSAACEGAPDRCHPSTGAASDYFAGIVITTPVTSITC